VAVKICLVTKVLGYILARIEVPNSSAQAKDPIPKINLDRKMNLCFLTYSLNQHDPSVR
jgi:hypothetical protein